MKKIFFIILMTASIMNLRGISNLEKAQNCFTKGCTLLDTGKYAEALKQFNDAINFAPDNPNCWDRRGTTYFSMQNYTAAISDYTQAINLCPQVGFYYMERALAYLAIGNQLAARNDVIIAANFGEPEALKIVATWKAVSDAEAAAYGQKIKQKTDAYLRERFGFKG